MEREPPFSHEKAYRNSQRRQKITQNLNPKPETRNSELETKWCTSGIHYASTIKRRGIRSQHQSGALGPCRIDMGECECRRSPVWTDGHQAVGYPVRHDEAQRHGCRLT